MSHFVTVVLLDEPNEGELELYEHTATARAEIQEAQHQAHQLGADLPIKGDAKTLRTWVEDRLGNVLEPFNENIEVEPYEEPCYCVGRRAKAEVADQLRSERPDLYAFEEGRERFRLLRLLQYYVEPEGENEWGQSHHDFTDHLRESQEDQDALRAMGLGELLDKGLAGELLGDERAAAQERLAAMYDEADVAWKAMHEERDRLEAERLELHPLQDTPSETCGFYLYDAFEVPKDATTEEIRVAAAVKIDEAKAEEPRESILPSDYEREQQLRRIQLLMEGEIKLTDPLSRAIYDRDGDGDDDGCKGAGVVMTTYSPNAQWDWWVVGGRWAGFFADEEVYDPSQDPRNYEPCDFCNATGLVNADGPPYHALELGEPSQQCHVCQGTKIHRRWGNAETEYDVVPAVQYLGLLEAQYKAGELKSTPYAMILPDGTWIGRGKMGWWGMSHGDLDQDNWAEVVLGHMREQAAGRIAVACDMHI
jgi:hypothetical protein